FELALSHGSGSYLYDVAGRRYLDLGAGIAVCCLGHAHPEITKALVEQSGKLVHVSNLYYTEPQGRLAEALVNLLAPGKVFFCNSGAEANEGLFKLARKFGHGEGRYEIITALNSFHGRTLAGIAATGQEKWRKGFEPAVPGFRHVPYNDLDAVRAAISPATVAVLIEGIQGEGGITAARPEFRLGLRQLFDETELLLFLVGEHLRTKLLAWSQKYPSVIKAVRGLGLMLGIELAPDIPAFANQGEAPSIQFVNRLHNAGLLTIPSGSAVIRLLPALNLRRSEAE